MNINFMDLLLLFNVCFQPVPPVFPVVLPSVPLVSQQISNPFYNIQHQQGNIQHNQLVVSLFSVSSKYTF